ncbi:hypothetical protein LINPERPRIM_LOCUS25004, partial [Linum perenne]
RGNQTISADVHFLVVTYSATFKKLKPTGYPPSILQYFTNGSRIQLQQFLGLESGPTLSQPLDHPLTL